MFANNGKLPKIPKRVGFNLKMFFMKNEIQKKQFQLDAIKLLENAEMHKLKGGLATSPDCACKSGCRSQCISGQVKN